MDKDNLEVIEGNKLIADFMGYHVSNFCFKDWTTLVFCDETGYSDIMDLTYWNPDRDWSELMEVIYKIERKYKYIVSISSEVIYIRAFENPNEITFQYSKSPIEVNKIKATWYAVIAFIKWKNENIKDVQYTHTIKF